MILRPAAAAALIVAVYAGWLVFAVHIRRHFTDV